MMASSRVLTSDIVPKMSILSSLSDDDMSNSPTFENARFLEILKFFGGPSIVGSKARTLVAIKKCIIQNTSIVTKSIEFQFE